MKYKIHISKFTSAAQSPGVQSCQLMGGGRQMMPENIYRDWMAQFSNPKLKIEDTLLYQVLHSAKPLKWDRWNAVFIIDGDNPIVSIFGNTQMSGLNRSLTDAESKLVDWAYYILNKNAAELRRVSIKGNNYDKKN